MAPYRRAGGAAPRPPEYFSIKEIISTERAKVQNLARLNLPAPENVETTTAGWAHTQFAHVICVVLAISGGGCASSALGSAVC